MKKIDILVTGGAGYIGSHTLVELHNSGYRPIIVDNLSNTSLANIKGAEEIIKNKITFYFSHFLFSTKLFSFLLLFDCLR